MTENKRFKLRLSKLGNGMITDTQKREDLYFDKEFLYVALPKINAWLNKLAEEKEQLKQAYNDAKKDIEKKEQILKDIMEENLLIQDMRNELKE